MLKTEKSNIIDTLKERDMPRFFVRNKQIKETTIEILGEDVKHIKNVLRKQIGDDIEICNQDTEKSYICKIEKIENESILVNIIEKLKSHDDKIKIDIYQGLPKADKMELIIQKSVELGANAIIPVAMKRCVVKIDSKDEVKKIARWQKIAESAAKQCGRDNIPEIGTITKIENIIKLINEYDSLIIAYENEKNNTIKKELLKIKKTFQQKGKIKIAVVIGPEGGLEEKDVKLLQQNGAKIVTLGNRILRTETVALNILSVIRYELED